jgi:hypothetical protein
VNSEEMQIVLAVGKSTIIELSQTMKILFLHQWVFSYWWAVKTKCLLTVATIAVKNLALCIYYPIVEMRIHCC